MVYKKQKLPSRYQVEHPRLMPHPESNNSHHFVHRNIEPEQPLDRLFVGYSMNQEDNHNIRFLISLNSLFIHTITDSGFVY